MCPKRTQKWPLRMLPRLYVYFATSFVKHPWLPYSVRPAPPFPLSIHVTASHCGQEYTSAFLGQTTVSSQNPRLAPALNTERRDGRGECVPLGWGRWHHLPRPCVPGEFRATTSSNSATLPGPHSPGFYPTGFFTGRK